MTDAEYSICVEKYIKMVYRIAFHYFGSREEAEDITQDVFMKLYSSNISREKEEEVKAWLIRVTTNACHNHFRNPFHRRRIDQDERAWEHIADKGCGEQDYIERKTVMDAVLSLPEKDRIIVYLYYYEEYSCCQIGDILQMKETTIQTRLARARDKLRSILEDSFPEKVPVKVPEKAPEKVPVNVPVNVSVKGAYDGL